MALYVADFWSNLNNIDESSWHKYFKDHKKKAFPAHTVEVFSYIIDSYVSHQLEEYPYPDFKPPYSFLKSAYKQLLWPVSLDSIQRDLSYIGIDIRQLKNIFTNMEKHFRVTFAKTVEHSSNKKQDVYWLYCDSALVLKLTAEHLRDRMSRTLSSSQFVKNKRLEFLFQMFPRELESYFLTPYSPENIDALKEIYSRLNMSVEEKHKQVVRSLGELEMRVNMIKQQKRFLEEVLSKQRESLSLPQSDSDFFI